MKVLFAFLGASLMVLQAAAYPYRIAFPDGLDQEGHKIYPGELSGITSRSKLPVKERLPFTTKEKPTFERCKEVNNVYQKAHQAFAAYHDPNRSAAEKEQFALKGLTCLIQAANYFHLSASCELARIFREGKWGIPKQPARAALYGRGVPVDWDLQYTCVEDEKADAEWATAEKRKEARIAQREAAFLSEQERLEQQIEDFKTFRGKKYTKVS